MADDPSPFAGHPLSGDGVTKVPAGNSGGAYGFEEPVPPTDDPAWQPVQDPTENPEALKDRASVINREIPNINVQTGWTIGQTRTALASLMAGIFDTPAQLIDSMVGDSRIQASLASLNGGLFSRPIRWSIPPAFEDDDEAKECLDQWQEAWPNIGTEAALSDAMLWDSMIGFWTAQLLWDTSDPDVWKPHLVPWHPRFTYYNWPLRKFIAVTMDGQAVINGGDGHWVLHAPHGEYRGWIRGAVRGVAPWWLSRNYALRDASRYSEKHGFPVTKAWTPFGADPKAIADFRATLSRLGQESIAQLPRSSDPTVGLYDIEYLEPKDQSWEVFFKLIEQCNMEITLALQAQNLTSEVKEGSLAAAREHGDVKQTLLGSKSRGFCRTIYTQMARPFAAINYGRAEIAPRMTWDIDPIEDRVQRAEALKVLATVLYTLRQAGKKVTDVEALARSLGLNLSAGDLEDVAPLQVEAKEAGATGTADAAEKDSATDDAAADDEPAPETMRSAKGNTATFALADRVQVISGKEHMPEHEGVPGTVKIIKDGAYGVLFDGTKKTHKWYAGDELEKAT
jgi:phage gp29-like protein